MEKQSSDAPIGTPPSTPPREDDLNDLKLRAEESMARDVDLGQMLEVEATPEQQRRVLWKLDIILIPVMGLCYMMQYMDKLALSQATLFGIREDLGLTGQQYPWASAVFYFGYFAWSWPSSYLIVRLPIGKYITASVLIWGGVLMCHAAATNFGGLMAARFFLGVGEAAIAPGFSLITGMFYKREEQPARQAAWFLGNCISTIVGGVVAYGIGSVKDTAVNSWQLLFIVLGTITAGMTFWLVFLLPDSPKNAIFLTKHERAIAVQRTLKNKTGVMDEGAFKWSQAWLAIRDPQTWFLVLYTFCVNLCNGGVTSVVFLIISAAVATFVPRTRILMMFFNTVVSLIGMLLVWKLDEENRKGRLTGLALGAVFAVNIPLSLSIISSNVAGFTKRSVTSGLLFVAYCVGNIVGPQFFIDSEEPRYPTGMKAAISGLAFGAFFLLCLLIYYVFENHRRDSLYGPPAQLTEEEEQAQGLSNKTDLEIESFRYLI
ncbi:major facilitator superfamily domain-containing protein [Aspergillus ambiguus]|uniref:major facilitator superfamily domain-containing protein n=1 Tax=Aspergillus ambiguus TaxID=176160 RepID=UPI003CCE143F